MTKKKRKKSSDSGIKSKVCVRCPGSVRGRRMGPSAALALRGGWRATIALVWPAWTFFRSSHSDRWTIVTSIGRKSISCLLSRTQPISIPFRQWGPRLPFTTPSGEVFHEIFLKFLIIVTVSWKCVKKNWKLCQGQNFTPTRFWSYFSVY